MDSGDNTFLRPCGATGAPLEEELDLDEEMSVRSEEATLRAVLYLLHLLHLLRGSERGLGETLKGPG